jgi:hypothetical protein
VIDYSWRGPFANPELNALHAEGFGHRLLDDDLQAQVSRHSLGWVCAREGSQLVGFVNVAWDGGVSTPSCSTLWRLPGSAEAGSGQGSWLSPRTALVRQAASGCTSTSKIICARSICQLRFQPHQCRAHRSETRQSR